jgi:hypothetical protein
MLPIEEDRFEVEMKADPSGDPEGSDLPPGVDGHLLHHTAGEKQLSIAQSAKSTNSRTLRAADRQWGISLFLGRCGKAAS